MAYCLWQCKALFRVFNKQHDHKHIITQIFNPSRVLPAAHFCVKCMIRLHITCTSYKHPYEPLVSTAFNKVELKVKIP